MSGTPPCARCGEPSDGFASAGAEPEPEKAVIGFASCNGCRFALNDLVAKLLLVVVRDDGTWAVSNFARDVDSIEARAVEGS